MSKPPVLYTLPIIVQLPDADGAELHLLHELCRRIAALPAARQAQVTFGQPVKETP